jgi:competence ComEA-like helix-hairpin-helix protein
MRDTAQRIVACLAVSCLIAAGAWKLRRPQPGAPRRCPRPAALQRDGRTLIACSVPVGGVALGRLREQLGIETETCPTTTARIVRAGELVRLGPRCDHVVEKLPARLRLLLGIKLEINQATAAELQALPRIGPKLAQRVVELRRRGGPFLSVEDLQRVKGIGPATVERLRPLVRVVP